MTRQADEAGRGGEAAAALRGEAAVTPEASLPSPIEGEAPSGEAPSGQAASRKAPSGEAPGSEASSDQALKPDEVRRALYAPIDHQAPWRVEETERLAVELGLHRGSVVLEVGCGTGALACEIARVVGCTVIASDLDPLALELTWARAVREGLTAHVSVRLADARSLFASFPGHSFDAVIAH